VTVAAQGRQPASTSLAVWDIASPAVAGERFTIKAGVKSSAGADLRGSRITVCDASGAPIGEGRLGNAPWPDTEALYWTELSLPAPAAEGIATLSVRFDADDVTPPHTGAAAQFSLAVTRAPEHTLTVKVRVQETARPLAGTEVRLGTHRATTDDSGSATLRIPKGAYELRVWKVGHDAPPHALDIRADTSIQIEAVIVPEENVDRAWKA